MSKFNRSIYAPRLWFGIQKPYAVIVFTSVILLTSLAPVWLKVVGDIILVMFWVTLAMINRYDPLYFTVLKRYFRRPTIMSANTKLGSQHYKKVNYKAK